MPLTLGLDQALFQLLDTTQDGVVLLDMEGKIRHTNQAFTNLFQKNAEELIDQTCDIFNSEPHLNFTEIVRDLSLKHSAVKSIKCKMGNGDVLKLTASFSFMRNDVVNHSGVMVVIKNSLLETEAEKKFLAQQNNLLRSFNLRTDEICLVYDTKNYRNIFCSDTMEQVLGWTAEEYYNGGWAFSLSITHPEDAAIIQKIFSEEAKKREEPSGELDLIPIVLEYRKRNRNGEYKWMRVETWVLDRDENGLLFHVIVFLKDITLEKLSNGVVHNPAIIELLQNGISHLKLPGNRLATPLTPISNLNLSVREMEILALIKKGFSTKQIADKLSLKINTVNTYRKNLMNKLSAKNSAELVNIAMEQNII